MKINFELDSNLSEIEVLIKASIMDETVNAIIEKLSDEKPKILVGFAKGRAVVLDENNIERIYTANKKVMAKTKDMEYLLKIPLYEAMERLNQKQFVRISNGEVVNLRKVIEFDLSFAGTICITLSNGDISYVSRRYVSQIKKTLGIGGK